MTLNRTRMRRIWIKLKEKKDIHGEAKTRSLEPDEKNDVGRKLGAGHDRHVGFTIDKSKGVPKGWDDYDGSGRIIGLLFYVMNWYCMQYPDIPIDFYIDKHNSYKKHKELIELNFNELKKTYGDRISKHIDDDDAKLDIEANDPVPHSLYLKHEKEDGTLAQLLQIDEFVLNEDSSIKLKVESYIDKDGKPQTIIKGKHISKNMVPTRQYVTANGRLIVHISRPYIKAVNWRRLK